MKFRALSILRGVRNLSMTYSYEIRSPRKWRPYCVNTIFSYQLSTIFLMFVVLFIRNYVPFHHIVLSEGMNIIYYYIIRRLKYIVTIRGDING